jgi:tetratricopeptide (TPR) repeat protein
MGQLDHIVRLALDGAFAQRPGLENALAAWERIYAKAGETQAAVNALLRVLRRGRHSEVATEIRDKVAQTMRGIRLPRPLNEIQSMQPDATVPAQRQAESVRTRFSDETTGNHNGQQPAADMLRADIALCHGRRDWPAALQAAQALNDLVPDQPEGLSEAAVALSYMGRGKEAEALVLDAIRRFPSNAIPIRAAASVAEVRQDYELALQRWADHRSVAPENRAGYVGALQILQKTRRLDLAGTVMEDAEERFPRDPKVLQLLAAIAAREGRWQEADAHWRKLVEMYPERPDFSLSAALAPMGHRRSRRERLPEILARLDALHEKFPDFIPAYLAHLSALRDGRQNAEAEARSRDWCERFPDNMQLALVRVSLFEELGRFDEALSLLQALRQPSPAASAVEAAYIRVLSRAGRTTEAEAACLEALRSQPDERALLSEYARIASRRGDWEEARARWQAALARLPGNRHIMHEITLVAQELAGQADADKFVGTSAAENLFGRFESLGGTATGCEFGMVQRKFGSEGLGLLRWTRSSIDNLVAALNSDLDGVGDEQYTELLKVRLSADREEYVTADRRFGMKSNTFMKVSDAPYDKMFTQTCRRLRFLRNKLVEDLRAAEKIFVFKVQDPEPDEALRALYFAARRYGNVTLMCVREADADNQRGSIRILESGLFVGYIGYFIRAGDGGSLGIDFVTWKSLAEEAERLRTISLPAAEAA